MPRPAQVLTLLVALGGCVGPYAGGPAATHADAPRAEEAERALRAATEGLDAPLAAAYRSLLLAGAEADARRLSEALNASGSDAADLPPVAEPRRWRAATTQCIGQARDMAASPWPPAWQWRSSVDCRANALFLSAFPRGATSETYAAYASAAEADADPEGLVWLVNATRDACDACHALLLAAAESAALAALDLAERPPGGAEPALLAIRAAEVQAAWEVARAFLLAAARTEGPTRVPDPPPASPDAAAALDRSASSSATWGGLRARAMSNADACAAAEWVECARVAAAAAHLFDEGALVATAGRPLTMEAYVEAARCAARATDPFERDLRLTEAARSLRLHADEPARVLHSYGILAGAACA